VVATGAAPGNNALETASWAFAFCVPALFGSFEATFDLFDGEGAFLGCWFLGVPSFFREPTRAAELFIDDMKAQLSAAFNSNSTH
jgi:hypothetical protein